MKNIIFTLIMTLVILPAFAMVQEDAKGYSQEQLKLRSDMFIFLKEEGFMPEYDTDGDIKFKTEGKQFYVRVSKDDDNPMYITIFRIFNYPDEFSRETFILATKELNLYKGIKVVCFDNVFRIASEMFVRDSEPVKSCFYKVRNLINDVTSDVLKECKKINTDMNGDSVEIDQIEVGNVDSDGKYITNYGSKIYSFNTQYLKPRITVSSSTSPGTYTFYVKLFRDKELSLSASSPENYTYKCDVKIKAGQQKYELDGWGSSVSGNWKSGNYLISIYSNGILLKTKSFKVY